MAYISVITDKNNKLTKVLALKDGKLDKKAPGHLVDGTIEAFDVTAVELIDLIKGLNQNQCLSLGVLDTPENQPIYCGKIGTPTRSKDFLHFFPENSFLLLDFDESGKTPEEALEILTEIDPQFGDCAVAVIPSSSSYIYAEDGSEIIGAGNYHIFVELKGERDPSVYGRIIFDRLLMKGYINPVVTKAGSVVIKSLIDISVMSPEREIFSANPVCKDGLISKRLDNVSWQEGPALDSDLISELDENERIELRLTLQEVREKLADKALKVRETYYKDQAKRSASAKAGSTWMKELSSIIESPVFYDKQGRPIIELQSNLHIMLEDGSLVAIKEFLLHPDTGLKLPDPIEPFKRGDEAKGIPGKGIATLLGTMIYSHHHCGVIYPLRWSPDDVIDIMLNGDIEDRKAIWTALSKGTQELSITTSEADLSEVAEAIKTGFTSIRDMRLPKEKKYLLAKIKPPEISGDVENDKILAMNSKYGMVNMSGKAVIVSEQWNSASQEFDVVYSFPTSMDTLFKNQPAKIPGVPQPVSLYKYWEQHPDRRTYSGIVFEPSANLFREPGKMRPLPAGEEYNLFQGYMYSPSKATNCDLIINHIREVWCSSDELEFNYTIAWLAHLFQYPAKLHTTALVMQSVPGAGKGIIIENCIVKVFGIHGISSSNQDDLVGRFNKHLGMNLFFYCNEMAYTARSETKSILKTLVETHTRMVEAKNIDKIKTNNYTSLIFSANDGWLLNLDHGDRRYVYLTVSSHRKGDVKYFNELKKQIDNGGKDAFVKYLLEYNIEGFDFTEIPDRKHKQRTTDFLRSSHPVIKLMWMIYDKDIGVAFLANDVSYKTVKKWFDSKTETMTLTKLQFFSLFREYCEYYKVDRKYDDPLSLEMQLEVGGILKRESETKDEYVMKRVEKKGVEYYEFCSVVDGQERLKV